MSTGMEEETVDWGDVEAATGEGKIDASASGGGDDVISLGGAEDLEEEEEVPAVEIAANGKKQIDDDEPAAIVVEKIPSAPSKPLPAGWKLQEARSGGVYYFNTVTGKTTWDFPTEDAKTSVKEKLEKAETTPAPEKLAGIQIRGAARGNNSAPISEEEALAPNKKREAETSAKEEVDAVDNNSQKRRRSNTPPERKKDSWSASPKPAPKDIKPAKPAREPEERAKRPDERDFKSNTGSWGRRPDIANQSDSFNGPPSNRPRPNENNSRESGHDARRRPEEMSARDRNPQQRNQHGNTPDQPLRNNQSDRSRPTYDDRRPSARDDRERNQGRARETSPAPRRRDDYSRGNERDQGRLDRDPPARNRDVGSERDREATKDRPRDSGVDQNKSFPSRDMKGERRDEPSRNSRTTDVERTDRKAGYRQGYHDNQPYNPYRDRSNVAPQRGANPLADAASQGGYNTSRIPQGYPSRGYPFGPANPPMPYPPGGQGYGQRGPPQAGNRPLKPWIAPEEKQKRWWNKNSGEKKPVDAEAFAESEGRSSSTPSRRSPSRVSVEPTVQKIDRERELADREAAIARKERELGLK